MELYVMRHGIAKEQKEWTPKPDSERPLTKKGKKEVRRVAKRLRKHAPHLDVILSSPYERAFDTAKAVAKEFKLKKKLEVWQSLRSGGDLRSLIGQLAKNPARWKSVLLVGHEPDLTRFVSLLTTGDGQLALDFPKAGVCKLTATKLRYGKCAALNWFVGPEQL